MYKIFYPIIFAAALLGCSEADRELALVCLNYDSTCDTLRIDIRDLVDSLSFYQLPTWGLSVASVSDNYICFNSHNGFGNCYLMDRRNRSDCKELKIIGDEHITDALIDEERGLLHIAHRDGLIEQYDLSTGVLDNTFYSDVSGPKLFNNADGSITVFHLAIGDWRTPFCCATLSYDDTTKNAVRFSKTPGLIYWMGENGCPNDYPSPYVSRNVKPATFSLHAKDTLFSYDPERNIITPRFYVTCNDSTYRQKRTVEFPGVFLTWIYADGSSDLIITSKQTSQSKFVEILDASGKGKVTIWEFCDGYYYKRHDIPSDNGSTIYGVIIGKLNDFSF